MTFTVIWKPSAADALANAWLNSACRSEVATAADDIDALLRVRPLDVGVSAMLNSRILVRLPLAVVYDVRLEDRLVQILLVEVVPGE